MPWPRSANERELHCCVASSRSGAWAACRQLHPVWRDEGMENQLMQAGGEKSHGDRRAMSDFIIAQKQAKPDEIQRQMRGHRIAQIAGRSKCWSRGLSIVEFHPAKDPEAAKDEASNRVAHDRATLCEDRPRRFR